MNVAMPLARFSSAVAWSFALALLAHAAVAAPPAPDMTLIKGHAGNFTQGDVGDTYTLIATNSGSHATSAAVTVVDSPPAGLTATNIAGTGWSCTLATLTCTCNTVLAGSTSYPA